jgi:hypothetical protein
LALSILLAAIVSAAASEPFALDRPRDAAPRFSGDNARWRMELGGFNGVRALTVSSECADGAWSVSGASLSGQKPPPVEVAVRRVVLADGRVTGMLAAGMAGTNVEVEVTGTVAMPDAATWWPPPDQDPFGEGFGWWRVMAEAQPVTAALEGIWKAGNRSGPVTGSLTPRREPGRFDMGVPGPKGLDLRFDMGRKRVNWNYARVAVFTLPKPLDLRAFAGLRVAVATSEPRRDVEVSVWLREEDGSWYYAKAAVPLVAPETEAFVDFRDFVEAEWVAPGSHVDEDYVFDRSAVSHFGVGLVNPLGIGRVSFTLRSVRSEGTRPPAPVATVSVTGRMLAVNGASVVPAGLFGGYAPDLPQRYRPGCQRNLRFGPGGGPLAPTNTATEAFFIDCMGDRFSPATRVIARDWKKRTAELGRDYALKARSMGYAAVMEWWNETYLDWARGAGARNYRTNYYDVGKAVEGGPVTIQATGEVFDLLRWKQTPTGWRVFDPTQFGYFSGRANGRIYDDMIAALGPALKEVGGVTLIAGWGFRWHEDHWAAWDLLYRPTIDRGIAWIDAICEHHYQGDTTAMAGSYEVLEAYAVTRHRKWLHVYNTECNDLLDAPARGVVDTPEKARAATNYRRMTYNLRDILYMILQEPDKAAGRTVIHYDQTLEGMDVAYGLMADLRGRLVQTRTSDPDVWCVASVDGTDPRAMPPDRNPKLVVFVFNDHREPAKVKVRVVPPASATLDSGTIEEVTVDAAWKVGRRATPVVATDHAFETDADLPGRGVWKVSFPLSGALPAAAEVSRHQAFAPDILMQVLPGKPVKTGVTIARARSRAAGRAWLRMVLEDVAPGEGWVEVGGARLALPASRTADNGNRIVELPLGSVPPAGKLPVRFAVAEGAHAGYRVDMVSVVLEEGPNPAAGL